MQFLDLTVSDLAENLALDETLLLAAETGAAGETLRIWEWPETAVVLGASSRSADDVDEAACLADGVPILRRTSGGGTVLLGRGCLLYSLVLAYERSQALLTIRSSYRYILGHICKHLASVAPGIELAGMSDLALRGKKVSGNSQRRKRSFLLHHGTLLYQFDASRVSRYLRQPQCQPDYRQGRAHGEFLGNLPLDRKTLEEHLRLAWNSRGR